MLLVYWQRAKASGMLEEDEKAFPSGQMFCDVECHGVLTLVFFIDMVLSDYCDYRLCDLEFCSNAGDDQPHALGYTQTQTKRVHT